MFKDQSYDSLLCTFIILLEQEAKKRVLIKITSPGYLEKLSSTAQGRQETQEFLYDESMSTVRDHC